MIPVLDSLQRPVTRGRLPGLSVRRPVLAPALAAACLSIPLPARAATITVDAETILVAGCSLTEAIQNANGGAVNADCVAGAPGPDTIELTLDVVLLLPPPEVTSQIVVQGNGFAVERSDTASPFSVFRVAVGGDLSLHHTTVRNGSAVSGGGIFNEGTLLLSHSTVSGNFASESGGGIANLAGAATLEDSTVSDNQLSLDTGPTVQGVGIYNETGTLTVTRSMISGNTGEGFGGGERGGGIHNVSGTVEVVDSTISGNQIGTNFTAFRHGPGISSAGGTVSLVDSTVSGNTFVFGGSGAGGLSVIGGSASATNSTISGNEGGIFTAAAGSVSLISSTVFANAGYGISYQGSATLQDTLLGQTNAAFDNCIGAGSLVDNGGNMATDFSCGLPILLTGIDPTLADNGGPTKTHALLLGSNAIDHSGACAVSFDQRGNPRDPGGCDAGAFELTCFAPDGAYVLLEMDTAGFDDLYQACWQIAARNGYSVPPGGLLTLRSGRQVLLGDDFRVDGGGSLTVEIDPSLQMPPRPKVVFVTSGTYPGGTLGGLAAADALCNQRASASGRSGSFKAWLSDSQCAVADACRGFTKAAVPYVRPDGVRVADDWADLTDGQLLAPISIDESGSYRSSNVWTGTEADASTWINSHCSDWSSIGSSGGRGWSEATDGQWSEKHTAGCNLSARLYCFEQ